MSKIRLADYVADFVVEHGITDCFTVVGGGAMHLNDAFGHKEELRCTYNHHEQASAIAAEGYARLSGRMALLCVTTGPGGTNALTGVLGGWLDSIPMFVVSGQVRYDTTARYNEQFTEGYSLRAVGDQEFDITKAAAVMCKYAVMLEKPTDIRYVLEKAWFTAVSGRPGPVWIDIPVNYQGTVIETDELAGFIGTEEYEECARSQRDLAGYTAEGSDVEERYCSRKREKNSGCDKSVAVKDESSADEQVALEMDPELRILPEIYEKVREVITKIRGAKRPVIYAGNGIRLAGAEDDFLKLVDMLGVPVCTYWDAIDLIDTDNPLYVGRGGNMGDRPGNFAVQNADLILAIGNRLPIRVTGYDWKTWAREAYVIMVDIDPAELRKPTIHVDMPVQADAKVLIDAMLECLGAEDAGTVDDADRTEWVEKCACWKKTYPVVLPKHWEEKELGNPYAAFDYISRSLPDGSVTVTSNGTCCVAGHQSWYIGHGSRFLNNNAVASMGYGLPAAIGACRANGDRETICLEGDGSIMMNLQELQTIATNRLPIKIFLINNDGYHSIRQTQNNIFAGHTKVGIGPESGDLSFPRFKKIADAFEIDYVSAGTNEHMKAAVDKTLAARGPVICEIFVTPKQVFEPKNSARRLEDGTIVSPPLEDLAPFLSREELYDNLYIKPIS